MLELKNVSKFYYQKGMISTGFSKVNLKFDMGEFIAITGESGSGKSTLLNVISGLDSYEEGEMYINGEETSYYSEKDYEQYRKKYIGNIFQSFNLVNSYTVYQNIELIYLLNGYKSKEVKEKILDLIDKVDLKKYKNRKVSKLSGGQKQRVAIARALAQNTPIILADEPTGNLDKKSSESVLKTLHEISKDKLVIVVTHNYDQIEDYVTRKITMNDGKVIEDKQIKKHEIVKKVETINSKKMRVTSKIKLGIRNSFNIVSKFAILLAVYLFVTLSLFTVYGTFNSVGESMEDGYNVYFNEHDTNRVVLIKKDKSYFTDEDINNIKNLSGIESIEKRDILLDTYVGIESGEFYFSGNVEYLSNVDELDYGRMPENMYEVVLIANKEYNYYISDDNVEEALSKEYHMYNITDENRNLIPIKIVGVKYLTDSYDDKIAVNDELLSKIYETTLARDYTTITYTMFGEKHTSYYDNIVEEIYPSKYVPKGKAYISENYQFNCKKQNCKNYKINITAETNKSTITKTVKVSKMYNKKNFTKLLHLKYKKYNGAIFINNEDYEELYDKNYYQISVFVNEDKEDETRETLSTLENQGFKTLYLRDTTITDDEHTLYRILNIIRLIVNIVLVVVLFFISYFIIKLVFKSRNIYYSTLRILGSTFKDTKKLLNIELFTIANLAYFVFVGLILLSKYEIIEVSIISESIKVMELHHYIILYAIISFMSILTAERYSRKLFVNSVMNTYREEV